MANKLQELILKLPEEFRPMATLYANVLERTGAEEIAGWIRDAIIRDWRAAHRALVAKMSTEELVEHQSQINKIIGEMNIANAKFIREQKAAVTDLIIQGLLMAV